jgi:hypothetical protein
MGPLFDPHRTTVRRRHPAISRRRRRLMLMRSFATFNLK